MSSVSVGTPIRYQSFSGHKPLNSAILHVAFDWLHNYTMGVTETQQRNKETTVSNASAGRDAEVGGETMSMVQGNPHDGLVRWSKTEMGVRSKCGRFEIQNWRGKAKGVDKNSWVVLINGKNVISNKGTLMTWRRLRDAKGYCTAKAYYFNMGGK